MSNYQNSYMIYIEFEQGEHHRYPILAEFLTLFIRLGIYCGISNYSSGLLDAVASQPAGLQTRRVTNPP